MARANSATKRFGAQECARTADNILVRIRIGSVLRKNKKISPRPERRKLVTFSSYT
jgi:hypothetical protein